MQASAQKFIPGAKAHPTIPAPSMPDAHSLKVLKVYCIALELLLRFQWCGAYGVCLKEIEEGECYCESIDTYCSCGDCKIDHSQHIHVKDFCSDFCEGVCRRGSNCPHLHPSLDEINDRISLLESFYFTQTEDFFEDENGSTGFTRNKLSKEDKFPTRP